MTAPLHHWIPQLSQQHIMVIGDIFLDEYVTGIATRLSREAAIPVLEFQSRRYIPGGAANPCANIVSLGSTAHLVGVVGDDGARINLQSTLDAYGISPEYLVRCTDRPTTVKTRLMAQMGLRFPQQLARIDTLSRLPISTKIEAKIIAIVREQLPHVQAVLFSDYHTGLLTPTLIHQVRELATAAGVILTSDTQGQLQYYRGLHLVKCNADDAAAYLGHSLSTDEDFATAASQLYTALDLQGAMVITRGAQGATLAASAEAVRHCPAFKVRDVYDTVGAGDTAIAVMTMALVAGASAYESVMLANAASGVVVQRVGNYAPTPQELVDALTR